MEGLKAVRAQEFPRPWPRRIDMLRTRPAQARKRRDPDAQDVDVDTDEGLVDDVEAALGEGAGGNARATAVGRVLDRDHALLGRARPHRREGVLEGGAGQGAPEVGARQAWWP